jgi:peptidoglycan/xylan/chitin deacetylase (PgdA/CDA1 family)
MILLYHKVAPLPHTRWWVSADSFDVQLAALREREVVYLDDYDPTNPRHAVITFDGVYENVRRFALPLLKKWDYPFELFVIGDLLGEENIFDQDMEPPARFASCEDLEALVAGGGRVP